MPIHRTPGLSMLWLALAVSAAIVAAAEPGPPVVTIRGTLVAKTATALEVRPEDETEVRRFVFLRPGYRLDPKYQAFINQLAVGSEIEITWTGEGTGRITRIRLLGAPGKSGKLVGTVTGIINGRLELEDAQGNRKQYIPRYVPGGDKEMSQAITQRHVGDRVEIRWFTDDWTRVSTMRVLELSPQAMAEPSFEGGTVVGKVAEKDEGSVTIQSDDGAQQRYLPQRIVGEKDGLDKDVLRIIAAAEVGDRLEARWFKDGERRIYSLRVVSAARPASRPDQPAETKDLPARTPEDQARDRLTLCQLYIDNDLREKAKELLRSLIKDFPGTEAAKEAAIKLKELSGGG